MTHPVTYSVGTVGYATHQGLGHLTRWFYQAGVITDLLIVKHPQHTAHLEWYPGDRIAFVTPGKIQGRQVDKFLSTIQSILFFETPFDWSFVDRCKSKNIRTVLMPMYEWTPTKLPVTFDLILAPSLLDVEYFPGSVYLPVPVPIQSGASIRTRALRFLHNAGHVGHRGHKGTLEVLKALPHVQSPISLTVRCQYHNELNRLLSETGSPASIASDPRLTLVQHPIPYDQLFTNHDVYVAPEKFNGLSLPLQEAHASGLIVMTSDRFPHNSWLPKDPLIPVHHYEKAQVSRGCLEFDEAVIDPITIAATIDKWYNQDITQYSQAGLQWAKDNSWEVLKPLYLEHILGTKQ